MADRNWWPIGERGRPSAELAEHLFDVAALHARRAVLTATAAEPIQLLDAATSVGAAIELIAKAAVATVEPSLIAGHSDASPTRTILLLRGDLERAAGWSLARDIRTVPAKTAVLIASEVHQSLTTTPKAVALPFAVRNAALHLGIVEPDELTEAVAIMASYTRKVLRALGRDPIAFWSPQILPLVTTLLDARATALEHAALAAVARAADEYARTLGRSTDDGTRAVIAALEVQQPPHEVYAVTQTCPACGNDGWVVIDMGVEVEYSPDGPSDLFTYPYIAGFVCNVCRLNLESEAFPFVGLDEVSIWQATQD